MDDLSIKPRIVTHVEQPVKRKGRLPWASLAVLAAAVGCSWYAYNNWMHDGAPAASSPATPPPAEVTVSLPETRELDTRLGFLGQFSAAEDVDLRAQVGGTLTAIKFKDGELVRKGDVLFVIDPEPYQIRLAQAQSQLETAEAKLKLAGGEFARAQSLVRSAAGTAQNVDQRQSELQIAQASVDDAKAQIRDAQFDLDHCNIIAPFSGRIGRHLVSVGSLVSGSRAGSGSTSLATLVSLDPIHLDFDMSEQDYLRFSRERSNAGTLPAGTVDISLGDEKSFGHQGKLDFIDNVIDRSSGTLHARATVENAALQFTPGQFARLRVTVGKPTKTLLVPDASVIPDQSDRIVMTVAANGTVVPKKVQVGDIRGGLRAILSGITEADQIIVGGIPYAAPGSKVKATVGTISFDEANGKD